MTTAFASAVARSKAIGVPTRRILAGLALHAVVLAVLAAVVGIALSPLLAAMLSMEVVVPLWVYLALPSSVIALGLLGSLAGLHRTRRR